MAENILVRRERRKLRLSKPKNIKAWIAAISSALLLMATIGSAFSVFQATLWTGQQAISYGQASAYRIESIRSSNFAVAQIQLDAALFTDWISAMSENKTELADFLEDRFREEFRPAFYAWLSKSETSADGIPPGTPFELPEYQLKTMKESEIYLKKAKEEFEKGSEANSINDRYISTTVLFAIVLFFTGIEPRWQKAKLKIAMTIVAAAIFIIAIFLISQLPILGMYGFFH